MLEFNIDIESIIKVLKQLPKEKQYETERISIARGKYKLKKNRFKWLKLLKSK
jgi:uncharacterized radical SAM superfamily Fe-S cluster-containing enzyme